jgi:hypothetical protein
MINIVCVKWGTKYGPEYVNRLYYGVKRNITIPFSFHCFTEDITGIHEDIITHNLPFQDLEGWWNKLYLFSEDLPLKGRIMFMDLDTLVVGNIDELCSSNSSDFIGIDVFSSNKQAVGTYIGSGLLQWTSGKHCNVWKSFYKNPKEAIESVEPHGDQMWIERTVGERVYWQNEFPGQVVWFPECKTGIPSNARIVCFQDVWKIHECLDPDVMKGYWYYSNLTENPFNWVPQHWKEE